MARERTGALIVLERDIGLRTFIESGVRLDSHISRDLLLSIFQPNTAMHDGAVIIQKERIAAAACFLPLTVNPALSAELGTRHRAALGITEETDCLALVVSEETGAISIAAAGELERGVHHRAGGRAHRRAFWRGEKSRARASPPACRRQPFRNHATPGEANQLIRLLTQHWGWKLFALAASFAIWLNVASEPDLTAIVVVPVEYSNFPRDLEISSTIVDSVDLEASGPAPQMRNLGEAKIPAVLDFSSVTEPGERTFTLTAKEIRLPRGTATAAHHSRAAAVPL